MGGWLWAAEGKFIVRQTGAFETDELSALRSKVQSTPVEALGEEPRALR